MIPGLTVVKKPLETYLIVRESDGDRELTAAECQQLFDAAKLAQKLKNIPALVDRFLAWKLPQSVCSDLCVTNRDYKFPRSGTNLLTADEARQMIEYLMSADT